MGNILVVGSKGFIGSHCYEFFKNHKDFNVIGCDIIQDYTDTNYYIINNISVDLSKIFQQYKFDFCFNCSGSGNVPVSMENPVTDFMLNTKNVLILLETIRVFNPECKFIQLSSAAIYGNPSVLPVKEVHAVKPLSPYGFHKLQAESICQEFSFVYNIKSIILRLFSVYGTGLKKQFFWDLFQKAKNDNEIVLFGTGNESRDFIFISDLIRIFYLIVTSYNFVPGIYNVANGQECFINQITQYFLEELNCQKQVRFTGNVNSGIPLNWKADISKIESLGYSMQVGILEGISKFISWAKDYE